MENNLFEYPPKENSPCPKEVKIINPKNPFDNFTEYEYYNSDYSKILPQIDIPGCEIPFEPTKEEKKKIRFNFNLTGIFIIFHIFMSTLIYLGLSSVVQLLLMKADGISRNELTVEYIDRINSYISQSSIGIGMVTITYLFCNLTMFFIGSKACKIKLGSYFQTRDFSISVLLSYFVISFFIRYLGAYSSLIFGSIFSQSDMTGGTQLLSFESPQVILLSVFYTCIIAPVTEEFFYRGFVLKNLSKVGQRFGIMMSALLFGLSHGNANQFFFSFFLGIFLAHITIKHNSIIPSILVHFLANTASTVMSYVTSDSLLVIYSLSMLVLMVFGIIFYVSFFRKNRLPYTMPHQKIRNNTFYSSPFLIAAIVIMTGMTILNTFPSLLLQIEASLGS